MAQLAPPQGLLRESSAPFGRSAAGSTSGEFGFPVFQILPPYNHDEPQHLYRFDSAPPGCVLGLEISRPAELWPDVARAVLALRLRAPLAPVVLRIHGNSQDLIFATTRAALLHVRGILIADHPLGPELRRQIARPVNLADDLVEWLGLRGVKLSPTLRYLVERIVTGADEHHGLASLLKRAGIAESSARARFRKKRLPPPGRWLRTARALHAALRLQAEPDRPLLSVALALGYSDHSALSHQIYRAFRLRPGNLRHLLGWEWLLDRWLRQERIPCR